MAKPIIGVLIILFINIFGLAIYFLIIPSKNKMRKKQKPIESEVNELKRIDEVNKLRNALEEEQTKNQKLEKKIKRLKNKAKAKHLKQPVKKCAKPKDDAETEKIKQKYPVLPKNQLERIEIERSIARSLMKNNGGSFHISQILRTVEELYTKHIKSNDRVTLLNEIKSWVERDPLCKVVKTTDNVQHYTFI